MRQEFSGKWSPRTITRYKRVGYLCAELSVDESGEVGGPQFEAQMRELDWATNFGNFKKNVAGMERMAVAKLRAKQAGCTEEEWAELKRAAQYPHRRFAVLSHPRVNVARLERLLWMKLKEMVNHGRAEEVHRDGRLFVIESRKR